MKKILSVIFCAVIVATLFTGCGKKNGGLKEINKYFFETAIYKSLDYNYVNDYFKKTNDNWGGGCSAISADINGERLVGRNMDLNISEKCAYFVKTDVEKKYKTFGLSYTFRDISPDYDEVKKNGLGEKFQKVLPFMCDDVINSEGLHIEINMRHGEQDENGNDVFGVEHTNKDAKLRAYVFTLGQYIALNCKDIPAVKKYLKNDIDVYSKKDYWNYCFLVTDAKGNSELLEFGNGKYYWTEPDDEGIVAQTNFYVNDECNKKEDIKTGLGRYETLLNGIKDVKNKSDLYNLMKRIEYSAFYLPYDECKSSHFDPRSEVIGEGEGLTYDFVMSPENEEFVESELDKTNEPYRNMSRKEKQALNALWESTFTEVVNPKEKTIYVRIFENEDYLYKITFDGVSKADKIK